MYPRIAVSFFGLSIALASAAGLGAEPQTVVVENRALQLEIASTAAPFVTRLVHKGSGRAVVDGPNVKNLFAIVLEKPDGSRTTVESTQAAQCDAQLEKPAAGPRLRLRFAKFSGADLSIEATLRSEAADPLTQWSIAVDNRTGWKLVAVRFPQLVAVPTIGHGGDDCLVLPNMPGTLVKNPAEAWRDGQSVTLIYPGNMSAQFLAYQDRSAGVYLAGMDAAGHPMALGVMKTSGGFRLWHEYAVVAEKQAEKHWQSPYPVALGVTQGTWCDSADQYKRWALRQPWCAKTLAQRDDVPAWWKQGPDVYTCEVRKYNDQRNTSGSYYPELVEHLRTWQAKIDGPVLAMTAGWENHRRWTAGDYFPVFDAQQAAKVYGELKQLGIRPFYYLSGLFYTYWNEGRDAGRIPSAEKYAASYVIDSKTGKPKEFALNESNPSGEWRRHSYEFCPAAAETKPFFLRVIDQAHALGVDALQMDQTTSGAGDACCATGHGHAPGAGLYQSHAFWDLLDAMRRHGKSLSPDFVLFHEELHEQLIPHLDGFHTREYMEGTWYRASPGAVGIPLFSYLYHEYAIGYGGDSAGLNKANDRWLVRNHAVNLVTGRTPGAAIWSSHRTMFEAHPDQVAMIRNHCRLLKTRAQQFLMLGRMLHPYELSVPELPLSVGIHRRGKWSRQPMPTPAVLTSSWQSPAGRIGHLFVNISESTQPLAVDVDTRGTGAAGPYDVEVYRTSVDGQAFRPVWQKVGLPRAYKVELAPGEVVFIEVRRNGQ